MESCYLTAIFSLHSDNSRRALDKLFFIDYLKERKKKYEDHRLLIIKVFKKWNDEVSSDPLSTMENSFPTFIPLYFNITNHIIELDSHGDALSHLNDSSYRNILVIYNTIKEREQAHNKRVSDYFRQTIPKIWSDIKTQSNIWEVSEVRELIRQGQVDENTKEGVKMGAVDENVGLYTSNLLEYLLKRSLEHMDQEFEIVDYEGPVVEISEGIPGRWHFYLLKSEKYLPDLKNDKGQITTIRVIAKSVATSRKSIEILKAILLTEEFVQISKSLKEFDNEIKEIQGLYSEFICEINKIVYNYSSLGLKGKCSVEKELDLKKVKS